MINMDNDNNGSEDNSSPDSTEKVNSSEMFKGYFGDENSRSVGKSTGGGTLELANFDSEVASKSSSPEIYAEDDRKVSTANFSLSTLELGVVDDVPHLSKPLPSSDPAKEPQEAVPDDSHVDDVPDVLIVSEEKSASLGVDARAFSSGSFNGPVVARRMEESFFEKLRDNYKAMVIIGAIISLVLGYGVATYYSNSSLQKDVKNYIIKREVAIKGAILLNDSEKISSFEKKEKSARKDVAMKTALVWLVFSGLIMGAWYKFAMID
jgi:hypothetical protein